MKKRRILIFCSLLMLLLSILPTVYAQEAVPVTQPTPTLISENSEVVSFTQAGFERHIMRGELDVVDLFLTIPSDWRLLPGGQLELSLEVFTSRSLTSGAALDGTLEISFEDYILDMVTLSADGVQNLTLPLPAEVLTAPNPTGRYHLQLVLRGQGNCNAVGTAETSVMVQPSSRFILPHELVEPTSDLRLLPRPFYQRSFFDDSAHVVIPDAPTSGELQAAMRVMAAFGKMSSRNLALTLVQQSGVTAEIQNNQHLIVVGKTSSSSAYADAISLLAPAAGQPDHTPEDGLLQIAPSPWNSSKAILYVGGDTDTAVNKAALALGAGQVRTEEQTDIAVVEALYPERAATNWAGLVNRFGDLGYEMWLVEGIGGEVNDYQFYVPSGYNLSDVDDVRLEVVYVNSALLDYSRSVIDIELNGMPVGSVALSGQATQVSTVAIEIPASTILSGLNTLTLQVDIHPIRDCSDRSENSTWLAIWPETTIHLPLIESGENIRPPAQQLLSDYPQPFSFESNLKTTTMILPKDSIAAWQIAAQFAIDLGGRLDGILTEFRVAYAEEITDSLRQSSDLLLIGQASSLPILAELSDAMPSPFAPGENAVADERLLVQYNISPDIPLGYLEMFRSPWNHERMVMLVSGNTEAGMTNAANALLSSAQRRAMKSDFAVVDREQVYPASQPFTGVDMTAATPAPSASPTALPPAAGPTSEPVTTEPAAAEQSSLGLIPTPPANTTNSDSAKSGSLSIAAVAVLGLLVAFLAFFIPRRFLNR